MGTPTAGSGTHAGAPSIAVGTPTAGSGTPDEQPAAPWASKPEGWLVMAPALMTASEKQTSWKKIEPRIPAFDETNS